MRVGILGDGAMGTVCALVLAEKHAQVTVWGHDAGHVAQAQRARENVAFLPGFSVPACVTFTADAAAAIVGAAFLVCAVPTQFIRPTLSKMAGVVSRHAAHTPVVSIAKGLETSTLERPTEIVEDVWREKGWNGAIAALSGPNIATEIARKLPATMVAASEDAAFARKLQQAFTCAYVRVYSNTDRVGVELAGAMKNVIAIAAGILDGMGVGHNAKAALLARGLVEISRLGLALGARSETFAGLAGLGDLVTTCFSPEGRNRSFGERVGRGESVDQALSHTRGVVEGMPTCKAVLELARQKQVEMPICAMLHAVLFEGKHPTAGIRDLMGRQLKGESADAVI